jgi:hypothetical protein
MQFTSERSAEAGAPGSSMTQCTRAGKRASTMVQMRKKAFADDVAMHLVVWSWGVHQGCADAPASNGCKHAQQHRAAALQIALLKSVIPDEFTTNRR